MSPSMSSAVTITPYNKSNYAQAGSWDVPPFADNVLHSPSARYQWWVSTHRAMVIHESCLGEAEPPSNDNMELDVEEESFIRQPFQGGLGIHGLMNVDGTVFDGTGIVGIARDDTGCSRQSRPHTIEGPQEGEIGSCPSVSRTMITELVKAFTSSSSRRRLQQRNRARSNTLSPTRPAQDFQDHFMEFDDADDAGYFASIQTLPVLGLGILGLTRNGGEVFDGMGMMGLRERTVG